MYDYQKERCFVFTEPGQVMFLAIRDRADELLAQAGAVRFQELTMHVSGDSFNQIACVDRLVELGELRAVTGEGAATQHTVYVRGPARS